MSQALQTRRAGLASSDGPGEPEAFGQTSVRYVQSRSILTATSGFMSRYKFTLNPYGGCGFGCEYCYARFFAPTREQRDNWGAWVSVKRNARELIERACVSGELSSGDAVYMSSVTDPYQPIERRLRLTRGLLEALLERGVQPRLTVQTRSPIVTRDIDLLRQFERLRVNFTIGTDCEDVRLRYEPHSPSIAVRFRAAARLAAAGIRIGVSISPMLPIVDVDRFGARRAALEADEYVAQELKPPGSRFVAGSDVEAIGKARADGWGPAECAHARDAIARILGSEHPLLEGAEGYAPA